MIEFLRRKQAIAHLGLQPRVFERLVRSGELTRHVIRGVESYSLEEVDLVKRKLAELKSPAAARSGISGGALAGISAGDFLKLFEDS